MYCVNGKHFGDLYRNRISGYAAWREHELCCGFYFNAANLAFNRWNEIIDDKVLVTAMVDRLTHKAILLNMTGKSYRMKETQEMMNQQI